MISAPMFRLLLVIWIGQYQNNSSVIAQYSIYNNWAQLKSDQKISMLVH